MRAGWGTTALLAAMMAVPAAALAGPIVDATVFNQYVSPFPGDAGETSIGVNPHTNNVFFQRFFDIDRVRWNDAVSPPAATWTDVSPALQVLTLDPILYTNPNSGKTYVGQLVGAGGQLFMTTDLPVVGGDGLTLGTHYWVPTEPAITFPFFDHPGMGAGPHRLNVPTQGNVNPDTYLPTQAHGALDAMYYCAQLGYAVCMRSDDDGLTWGPYVPINLQDVCGGLTGHPVVGRDGTVYVPNAFCPGAEIGEQGIEISRTDGVTWATTYIPDARRALSDPVIAIDRGGRVWVAMSSQGKPSVSWSDDVGTEFAAPVNVDPTGTIQNTEFPMMVAGDAGRAAMAFYGTTTAGDDQSDDFAGAWHLYVSITVDNGATWSIVDTTPSDPVQRGCIWLQGGNNPCRNLLDFQGATVDVEGRIIVGYADGCVSAACIAPTGTPAQSRASVGTIARLTSGPRMYAAFD
jgi:hypothetical protein